MKFAMKASAVSAAEPMAKPLPVAAVVLPKESSASVRSRASSGSPPHLRDAARVIGNRAVSIGQEGDAEGREHTDRGEGDTVKAQLRIARVADGGAEHADGGDGKRNGDRIHAVNLWDIVECEHAQHAG